MTTPTHAPFITLIPGSSFRQYILLEKIGFGGQGVVWSALDQSQNRVYAIKFNEIPDSDETQADDIRAGQHLEKLIKLQHAHILPFHDYGFDEGVRFTVSPYVPGGTLTQKIKTAPLSLDDVLRYGMEIASALDYLHQQGVIHRDLKSSNILLNLSDHSYLADFGLARFISTSTLAFHTGHGTPPYAPPEQIRLKEITPRSDIYSFGILLFEMFTGQLPWNGKKQLGMEQLHSAQELPNPREINADLPPLMADVLRRITSADPALRPRSAGDVMKMICYIFNIPYAPLSDEKKYDELAAYNRDIDELLRQGYDQWESTNGVSNLGLTKFALIDLERKRIDSDVFNRFLLAQSLTYGYNDDQWWSAVSDPSDRISVSSSLLGKKNEAIAARVLEHLTGDLEVRAFSDGLPKDISNSLLEIGTRTNDAVVRQNIFDGIRRLSQPGSSWNAENSSLSVDQLKQLGDAALEDSDAGDAAAELIGHLRSSSAVRAVLNHSDEERKIDALLLIQQAAGSLPSFLEGGIRFRLFMGWIIQRLVQQPVSLIGAYMMAFLGAALGIGIQVYLTYNLADLFDNLRITLSLERGLIVGSVFGLGVFMTRVLVERFQASSALPRVVLGTAVGGLVMNIALLVFHVLFVKTPPMGFLITGGCTMIALGFASGSLTRSYPFKMFLSSASIFIAIIGTWWLNINFAASNLDLTPVFRYDYAWSMTQVLSAALGVALPIGILGNLISLAIKEE